MQSQSEESGASRSEEAGIEATLDRPRKVILILKINLAHEKRAKNHEMTSSSLLL